MVITLLLSSCPSQFLIPGNYLSRSLQFSWQGFQKWFAIRAERQWVTQGHPAGFVLKHEELMVSCFLIWRLNHYTKQAPSRHECFLYSYIWSNSSNKFIAWSVPVFIIIQTSVTRKDIPNWTLKSAIFYNYSIVISLTRIFFTSSLSYTQIEYLNMIPFRFRRADLLHPTSKNTNHQSRCISSTS